MRKLELVEAVRGEVAKAGLQTQSRVGFSWMSNRVPIEDGWSTPPRILYRLSALHLRLGGDWELRQEKRERQLRFDLLVGDSTVIEVDTEEHFSSARQQTLGFYDSMDHSLDLEAYASLCEAHHSRVDQSYQSRRTADFPSPGGRLAQIAYFDFAKDVLAPAHGLRLIRLPAPENELTQSLLLRLRVLL